MTFLAIWIFVFNCPPNSYTPAYFIHWFLKAVRIFALPAQIFKAESVNLSGQLPILPTLPTLSIQLLHSCIIPTLVSEGSWGVVRVGTFAFPVQIFKAKSVNLSGISQGPGLILYFGWQISKNLLQMGIFQDIRFSIVSVKYGSKVSRWKSCKCRGGKEQVLLPGHKRAKSGIYNSSQISCPVLM